MKTFLVGAALVAAVAAPVQAQDVGPVTSGSGSVLLSPYVGYMQFGEYAEFADGTGISFDNKPIYGAQLGYSLSPNFSVLGNIGFSNSAQALKGPGAGTDNDLPISNDVGVLLYDANVQFRLPFALGLGTSRIAPFVQGGVGQIRYTENFNEAEDLRDRGTTNTAFNVGLGADFQLFRFAGLRVMVKDYITSSSWDDIENVSFDDNVRNNTANNFAYTVGLNFGF
jgi:opacity protein-like surface antigen